MTVVFDAHGSLDSPRAMLSGYEPALATAAAISVLGAVAALGISRRRAATSSDDAAAIEEPAAA